MSYKATRWAWPYALSPTRKLVLLALADRADECGCCYPSIARIAEDTALYRETITEAIKALEAAGLLSVERRQGGSSTYRLALTAGADPGVKAAQSPPAPPAAKAARTPRHKPLPATREKPLQNQSMEPVKEPGEEDKGAQAPRKPAKTTCPVDFQLSPRVMAWGAEKGFDRLAEHLDHFTEKARAKGYVYADWDAALMCAIREDWARIRQPGHTANHPGDPRHAAFRPPLSAVERCRQSAEDWLRDKQPSTVIDINDYRAERSGHVGAVDPDGGDLRPPLDGAIRG